MLPHILMNMDFAATPVSDVPPGEGGGINDLLLLGVGRMVLLVYPLTKVIKWLSSLLILRG
jgi:hypothetical protein